MTITIGAHLSMAKGFPRAAETARLLGLDTLQFFTRNPRGGRARVLGEAEVAAWHQKRKEFGLGPVVAHLPYTVNLGTVVEKQVAFADLVLREDLARAALLGVELVVVHPGRHDGDIPAALRRVADRIGPKLTGKEGPWLLLEVMAGQGRELGGRLEELAAVLEMLDYPPRLGICLDTAHLHGAGWNLQEAAVREELASHCKKLFGEERVRLLHLNDSTVELGSRKDRHAPIGRGEIGEDAIRGLLQHPFFRRLPLILETPVKDYQEYEREAEYVRKLV